MQVRVCKLGAPHNMQVRPVFTQVGTGFFVRQQRRVRANLQVKRAKRRRGVHGVSRQVRHNSMSA